MCQSLLKKTPRFGQKHKGVYMCVHVRTRASTSPVHVNEGYRGEALIVVEQETINGIHAVTT